MQPTYVSLPYIHTDFSSEVMSKWSEIAKEVPNKTMRLESPKKEIKRAFEAYQNALNGPLEVILLGDASLRENMELIQNFGSLATESQVDHKVMKEFLKKALIASDSDVHSRHLNLKKIVKYHVTQGAIMYDSKWWILRNDAFILGGIHSKKQFHIVQKTALTASQIWDFANNRPTVLGRELIMLMAASYSKVEDVDQRKFGMIFIPPCERERLNITLMDCREKIASITRLEDITNAFNITLGRERARTI